MFLRRDVCGQMLIPLNALQFVLWWLLLPKCLVNIADDGGVPCWVGVSARLQQRDFSVWRRLLLSPTIRQCNSDVLLRDSISTDGLGSSSRQP